MRFYKKGNFDAWKVAACFSVRRHVSEKFERGPLNILVVQFNFKDFSQILIVICLKKIIKSASTSTINPTLKKLIQLNFSTSCSLLTASSEVNRPQHLCSLADERIKIQFSRSHADFHIWRCSPVGFLRQRGKERNKFSLQCRP